jgi:hypothetical protein
MRLEAAQTQIANSPRTGVGSAPTLNAYFDESRGKGFVVVGGWIASVEDWEHFEVDWKLFLIAYKVPYFHMKELAHFIGPYEKWKNAPNFRARFMRDAWDIISSRVRRGFICEVHDIGFDRIDRAYELREKFSTPYALVGRECIAWADDYGAKLQEEVRCIFDDGDPDKGSLLKSAIVVPSLSIPIFEPCRDIQDRKKGMRKGLVQIQAADFLTYEVGKFIRDHPLYRNGRRDARISLGIFGQKRPDTKFFNEQRLLGHCQRFAIKRRAEVSTAIAGCATH